MPIISHVSALLLTRSCFICRIPIIGGRELDLHRLFVEVTARGGMAKVRKTVSNYYITWKAQGCSMWYSFEYVKCYFPDTLLV